MEYIIKNYSGKGKHQKKLHGADFPSYFKNKY